MDKPLHVDGMERVTLSVPIEESYEEDGDVYLVGLASVALEKSYNGIIMTDGAVARMKESCIGLPGFVNHDPDRIFGRIIEVVQSAPTEFRPVFKVLPGHDNPDVAAAREKVMYWLENDIPLGLSIGASVTDWRFEKEDGDEDVNVVVEDLELLEVSVTPIPAVKSTKGTLRKVQSSINQCIAESIKIEEAAWSLHRKGYSHALSLVRAGKYTDASWSKPSLSDFNGDVGEYSKYCLAYDPGGDPENASTYGYPFGKDGEVYINALKAIKSAAAGGRGAERNQGLYDAADRLLKMIESKEESSMDEEIKEVLVELKEAVVGLSERIDELKVPEEADVDEEAPVEEPVDIEGVVREEVLKLLKDEEFLSEVSGRVLREMLLDREVKRPVAEHKPADKVEEKAEAYTSLELIQRLV